MNVWEVNAELISTLTWHAIINVIITVYLLASFIFLISFLCFKRTILTGLLATVYLTGDFLLLLEWLLETWNWLFDSLENLKWVVLMMVSGTFS